MKRHSFLITFGLILGGIFCVLPQKVEAAALFMNDYPYMNNPAETIDIYSFRVKNCTSYVAWRMNRDRGISMTSMPPFFKFNMQGPNGHFGNWGDAHNWDDNAATIGYTLYSIPRAGDIAVWEINTAKKMPKGHVAYVESVNADGSANISEYNFSKIYDYGERNNVRADKYIRINSIEDANIKSFNGNIYQAMLKGDDEIYTRFAAGSTNLGVWTKSGGGTSEVKMEEFDGKLFQTLVGQDNGFYSRYFSNGVWSDWLKAGGGLSAINMKVFNNKLYQSALGLNKVIYTRSLNAGSTNWGSWTDNGASGASEIIMEVFGGKLYQTILGSDQGIYTRSSTDGITWTALTKSGGGISPINMKVFNNKLYQTVIGTDNSIYTRNFDGITWSSWDTSGGGSTEILMEVFDGQLFQTTLGWDQGIYTRHTADGVNWSSWLKSGGGSTAISMAVHNNQLYQTVLGLDRKAYLRILPLGGTDVSWSTWDVDQY